MSSQTSRPDGQSEEQTAKAAAVSLPAGEGFGPDGIDPATIDPELVSWVRTATEAAEDKLGQRTVAFYVGPILGITDWFVVTSGRNSRQVRAIVDAVEEAVAKSGGPKPIRIEGRDTLSWVLMDYGFLVVHVFTEEAREYYELERLWRDVPRLDTVA